MSLRFLFCVALSVLFSAACTKEDTRELQKSQVEAAAASSNNISTATGSEDPDSVVKNSAQTTATETGLVLEPLPPVSPCYASLLAENAFILMDQSSGLCFSWSTGTFETCESKGCTYPDQKLYKASDGSFYAENLQGHSDPQSVRTLALYLLGSNGVDHEMEALPFKQLFNSQPPKGYSNTFTISRAACVNKAVECGLIRSVLLPCILLYTEGRLICRKTKEEDIKRYTSDLLLRIY